MRYSRKFVIDRPGWRLMVRFGRYRFGFRRKIDPWADHANYDGGFGVGMFSLLRRNDGVRK